MIDHTKTTRLITEKPKVRTCKFTDCPDPAGPALKFCPKHFEVAIKLALKRGNR